MRPLVWIVILLSVLLGCTGGALAQDFAFDINYTAKGMQQNKDAKGKVTKTLVPQDQKVTVTWTIKGGTPPYEAWAVVNGIPMETLKGKGPTFRQDVPHYGQQDGTSNVTIMAQDSLGRKLQMSLDLNISAPLNLRPPKPVRATPKPTPVPGQPYTPIGNIVINGATSVKAGVSNVWVATFTGGEKPHHYRWRAEGPSGTRVIDGKTQLSGKFARGPVKLTFLIWDDHTGQAGIKMTSITVNVDVDKPAAPPAADSGIGGWWLWIRGKDDLVPVFLTAQSNGTFNGPYWPGTNMKRLATTGTSTTSRLAFKVKSGNTYVYRYSYPSGEKGSGEMTFSGKSATGTWKDDPPGKNSGTWKWGRPSASALAKLKAHFGR